MNEREVKMGEGAVCTATGKRCTCFDRGGKCRAAYKSPAEKLDAVTKRHMQVAEMYLEVAQQWLDLAQLGATRSYPGPELRGAIANIQQILRDLGGLK